MALNLQHKQLRISGMTCINCQNKIEQTLRRADGVQAASVRYDTGTAEVTYDTDLLSLEDLTAMIQALDYQVLAEGAGRTPDASRRVSLAVIILCLFFLLEKFGILNLLAPSQLADSAMSYGMLFVIGLVTSVHCVAMCGGINLSQCLPQADAGQQSRRASLLPAFLYNLGRVLSYTAIGFLLGLVVLLLGGGGAGPSPLLQGILKLIAGVLMVIMGLAMLDLFLGLRRLTLRPPRFLAAKVGAQKARHSRPLVVGLLNGLMPCGPLQSMQLVALAAGDPFSGALAMFLFSLGTVPLMLGLGSAVAALGRRFSQTVRTVGAVLVVVLGLAMLSQGWSLTGFSCCGSLGAAVTEPAGDSTGQAVLEDGTQVVTSTLSSGRYPDITVQAGVPVRWIIDAPAGSINGCNYKMLLQAYGITYTFQEGENILEFTPTEPGTISYSCWMGMIRGTITVTGGS